MIFSLQNPFFLFFFFFRKMGLKTKASGGPVSNNFAILLYNLESLFLGTWGCKNKREMVFCYSVILKIKKYLE